MAKVRVGGIDIYYETSGEGEPLLFIDGLGSSTRDWEFQVDFFSQDYQVVVFDVRGHGRSGKPRGPYSIPLFARDTAELIKVLGISPVHVVGISMGGMIGLQLVVDAPDLVRSLVVVNSNTNMTIDTLRDRMKVWQRSLIVRILGMRKMGEVLSKMLFPKDEQVELRQTLIERWSENDPQAYRAAFKAILSWSVDDKIEGIACPVLVVAADQDYTPVEVKATYVTEIPRGEMVVIEDSRHATPVERPQEFNQALKAFLDVQ